MGYLIALAGTFAVVSSFGLPQTAIVYRAKGESVVANQINLLLVITSSVASIILLFINEFSAFLCLGLSFFFLYQQSLLGEKKYKKYLKSAILRNVFTFAIPFPLYFVLGIPGIILGMAIGNILGSLGFVKYTSIQVKSLYILKDHYKVLINNFGVDASSRLVRFVDRLLIGTVFSFVFLGLYQFNMQILFALEILPRVLYFFLLSEESSGRRHKKISYLVILASGLISLAVIILSPIFIEQFFPNYSDGIESLQILVISLVPLSITSIISAKLQAKESTKVGYSAIVSIGSLLILLSLLGNAYGMVGLSLSVLISTILNTIFLSLLYYSSRRT